jgi:ATP-binding cassette subfamily C (CFTR/MRP) protein 1
MAQQFQIRKKTMKYTDQRAKTLLEVLGRERQLSQLEKNSK